MARKNKRPKPTGPAKQPESIQARIVMGDPDGPTVYANFAEVTVGPHEYGLTFGLAPSKLTRAQTAEFNVTGAVKVDPLVQVVFAPSLLPGLIRALQTLQDKHPMPGS